MCKSELLRLVSKYTEVPKRLKDVDYWTYRGTHRIEFYKGDWKTTATYDVFFGEPVLEIERTNGFEREREMYRLGVE